MTVQAYVYAFFAGDDDEPRYIGLSNDPKRRFRQHMREAQSGHNCHRCNWIRKVGVPRMQIMGPFEGREFAALQEQHVIYYYRNLLGCRLTNLTDGGDGYTGGKRGEEVRRKLSAATTRQLADPEQRRRRSEAAKRQWASRYDEMAAAVKKSHGETWHQNTTAAARKRMAVKWTCHLCGQTLADHFRKKHLAGHELWGEFMSDSHRGRRMRRFFAALPYVRW